jgi:hypothetical protein
MSSLPMALHCLSLLLERLEDAKTTSLDRCNSVASPITDPECGRAPADDDLITKLFKTSGKLYARTANHRHELRIHTICLHFYVRNGCSMHLR